VKRTISFLIFFVISINAYSQWGINGGILGVGFSGTKAPDGGYVYGQLLNISYQTNFGLGFTTSPLDVYHYFYGKENDTITFVNISSYFDFVKDEDLLFAPFVMVRLVDCNKFDFIEFRTGLKGSINNIDKRSASVFKNLSFMFEVGYNYNNRNQQGYYVHIGMDIISFLFMLGGAGGMSSEI
jgi:hypothetical protein